MTDGTDEGVCDEHAGTSDMLGTLDAIPVGQK